MSTSPSVVSDQINVLREHGYLVLVISPNELSGMNRADVREIESLLIERAESLIETFSDSEDDAEPHNGAEQ